MSEGGESNVLIAVSWFHKQVNLIITACHHGMLQTCPGGMSKKEALICTKGQENGELNILRKIYNLVRKLIKNAKIDYLRKLKKTPETMSIEELFESEEPIGDKDIVIPSQKMTFDFEEERLAKAFYELPLMKRKILEMLFVEEIKPEEIAKKLNCSSQYVYNQKFRAIKTLREQLCKGDNTDE